MSRSGRSAADGASSPARVLVLILLLPMLSCAQSSADCFPPEARLDKFRSDWFCRQLTAAKEARLAGEPSYRFSYIPSFHATRIVVAFKEEGHPVVVGKVLSGKGGYEAGTLAQTTRRALSADEWRRLEQRLENAGLWEPPDRDDRVGADGAEWIVEGRKGGRYSFHVVWSPTEGTFPQYRKVCSYMLELAGISPAAQDLY